MAGRGRTHTRAPRLASPTPLSQVRWFASRLVSQTLVSVVDRMLRAECSSAAVLDAVRKQLWLGCWISAMPSLRYSMYVVQPHGYPPIGNLSAAPQPNFPVPAPVHPCAHTLHLACPPLCLAQQTTRGRAARLPRRHHSLRGQQRRRQRQRQRRRRQSLRSGSPTCRPLPFRSGCMASCRRLSGSTR